MIILKIKVAGSDIKIVKEEHIVVGSEEVFQIQFQFDKKWNDLKNKVAVFYQPSVNRDNPISKVIDEDNKVYIPASCTVAGDYLYIGVFGSDESGVLVRPTIYTHTYVYQGANKPLEVPDSEDNSQSEQINIS